jgi:glycosyltransferase involved in cell wall biosynthesis
MSSPLRSPENEVAIVMRTFDRPLFLTRAVQSVLKQSYQSWRLIIVNSGAPDDVQAVMNHASGEFRGRVVVIQSVQRGGLQCIGCLTNEGLAAAEESRWVTVLDDDDTWHSSFLARAVERLTVQKRHPDVRGVAAQSMVLNEVLESGALRQVDAKPFNPGLRRIELMSLAASNLFTGNAFVYEREVLSQIGLYSETLPVLDDWDFNLRFALKFDIDVISEPLANYHRRMATSDLGRAHQNTSHELHDFIYNKIVNDHLRADLARGLTGLGPLMAVSSRLRAVSEKIGKIEQRTRARASLPKEG